MAAITSGIESDPLAVPQEDDAVQDRERQAQVAHVAALAHAADAEREDVVAQQERDAADARVRAALKRAARERAAAAPPPPVTTPPMEIPTVTSKTVVPPLWTQHSYIMRLQPC